jgi:hypothetical protein
MTRARDLADSADKDIAGTLTLDGLTVDGNGSLLTLDNGSNPATISNTNGNITLDFDTTNAGRSFNIEENGNKALRIDNNGDISFYEDTGTTPKFFWDASAESLGIGTSSPSAKLEVKAADLGGTAGDSEESLRLATSNTNLDKLVFTNERLSTGTTWLSAAHRIQRVVDVAKMGYIQFGSRETDLITFGEDTTERMRIDGDGNVLVGTTSTTLYAGDQGEGFAYRAGNELTVARSGAAPVTFVRQSNDGTIVNFKKDTTPVGSIGTSGGYFFINGGNSGGTHSGLRFINNASIRPCNTTGNDLDATLDLGTANARFKNLYLSGGVFLGGTGSSNKLDDYEEGTWTPVFSDANSGGNTAVANAGKRGVYTKIGNQVTVSCSAGNLDTTGMLSVNDLRIQGLPFTPKSYVSPNHYWLGGTRLGAISFNTNGFVTAYVSDALTYVRLGETVSGSSIDNITISELSSGAADIDFTITYHTAA